LKWENEGIVDGFGKHKTISDRNGSLSAPFWREEGEISQLTKDGWLLTKLLEKDNEFRAIVCHIA